VLAVATVAAWAAPLPAQVRPAVRKQPAGPSTTCGSEATLSLTAAAATQGGLILATLYTTSKPAPASVHAKWDAADISFWPSSTLQKGAQIWHALVPVDLEKPPGDYSLAVEAQPGQTPATACQLTIHVAPGKFATESLKVAPQFVEPDPAQLERAKKEGQRLREIYATVTPGKLWLGKFRIPLVGVTSGANFGRRRVLNGQPGSPHTGVDFPAPTGTPVHAAQAGRVVLAEPLYFAGNTVVIDHGLGVYTLYGHLSEISVKPGDDLAAGAFLGKVGATGRVTGPHLHWGLTVSGARVNALQIVSITGM